MSDESPYAGAGGPPYPPQRSDRWKIWLGIGLAVPALVATGVLASLGGLVDSTGLVTSVVGLAGLATPVVLLFVPSTRKVAVGLVIGYAIVIMLLAGACVALLTTLNHG
jgi:hypothetical protein